MNFSLFCRLRSVGLFASLIISLGYPQTSLDLNLGLSASKSILGISYTVGKNQVNLGLRGLAYSGRDGFYMNPGIAYNRYLTESGFYASAIYAPTYQSRDVKDLVFSSTTNSLEYRAVETRGWHPGVVMAGLGKSWQFKHWGLHTDIGFVTPADTDFAKALGLYFGGATSYRFKLGD